MPMTSAMIDSFVDSFGPQLIRDVGFYHHYVCKAASLLVARHYPRSLARLRRHCSTSPDRILERTIGGGYWYAVSARRGQAGRGREPDSSGEGRR